VNAAPATTSHHPREQVQSRAGLFLPRERRDDITVFYAWCRVIDDIADDGEPAAQRQAALDLWKQALAGEVPGDPPSRRPSARSSPCPTAHRAFPRDRRGRGDGTWPAPAATWDDLRLYSPSRGQRRRPGEHRDIGCRDPGSKTYAVELGLALQLTNILRDVGQDFANGGASTSAGDLARFGYTAGDLAAGRRNEAFFALMRFEAQRAREHYTRAVAARPPADRRALTAAEIMRAIYGRLLERMESGGFEVFSRRYSLSRFEKITLITTALLRSKFV
jgi:phytoene synthase